MQINKILKIDLNPLQTQNNLNNKFPSISLTSTSRALMSLSKKDRFDTNDFISTQISRQLKQKKQILDQLKSTTLNTQYTINKFREKQKSQTKISKTLHFVKKFERQKLQPSSSLAKIQHKKKRYQDESTLQNQTKIAIKQQNNTLFAGQVKYCDQKFGWVEGYAVSSHVGTLCSSNNTRICVATNLFRNFSKLKQVSFFGLFQGKNGSNKAQYMRQYFHNILINDELFYYNFQKAVSRSFQKIDKDFNYDPKYDGDYSSANAIICVLVGTKMHIIKSGAPNAIISMEFGSQIKTLNFQPKQTMFDFKSRKSISNLSTKLHRPKQHIHVRSFQLDPKFDYLILGNEGLNQVFNSKNQLGRHLWKSMFEDQSPNLKNIPKLAKVSNKICEQAIKKDVLGRCASIIVIQFKNMSLCFQEIGQLELPFCKEKNNQLQKTDLEIKYQENYLTERQDLNQKRIQNVHEFIRSLSNIL